MNNKILLLVLTTLLISCGKDPSKALRSEIRKRGYILYQNPLAHSGTGTLIGGRPSMMQLVSGPETCFPSEYNGEPTGLRYIDQSDLPSSHRQTTFNFGVGAGMLDILGNGNGLLNFGAGMTKDINITVEYEGATVEYIDGVKLKEFYDRYMSDTCKDFLDVTGYVSQALRVEKMRFNFSSKSGGQIDITLGGFLGGSVIPSANANWYVEDQYTLTIESPKYIGYQLGRLKREDNGYSLMRAVSIKDDAYTWETLNVFDIVPRRGESRTTDDERDFDIAFEDVIEIQ